MKDRRWTAVTVTALSAALLLALGGEAAAQKKKGKGAGKDKPKKQTEQAVGDEQKARKGEGKGRKYRPRALSDEQMSEWKDGMPPGWSMGGKKGWGEAGAPPGWMKKYPRGAEDWDEGRKAEWDRRVETTRERVREKVRSIEGMSEEDAERAAVSVEAAAREGVPIEQAEATVETAAEHGIGGEGIEKITRAFSYGTDKDVDYKGLGTLLEKKLEEGEGGNDLAVSIYEEIDRQSEAVKQAQPEEKKLPWYKRIFRRGD